MTCKAKQFDCVSCGECCRHIHLVEGLRHLQTNGICKYLVEDKCSIYENRPDLCKYEAVYDMVKDQVSLKDYDKISIYYCEELQEMKLKREQRNSE